MEQIRILTEDRDFDRLVHSGVPEQGDLTVALKRRATVGGNAGVVIAFTAVVDGKPVPVQAVTTLLNLQSATAALSAAAER